MDKKKQSLSVRFREYGAYIKNTIFTPLLFKNGNIIDYPTLWVGIILLSLSLVMVYSATISGTGLHPSGNEEYYLIRQAAYIGFSVFICLICGLFISMERWQKFTPFLLILSLLLLVLVLFVGTEVGITKRWISLGFFNIQPAELFKLACIFYLASFLTRRQEILREFRKVWWGFVPPAVGIAFIYRGGDFGTSVIIFVVSTALLLIGGLRFKWFVTAIAVGMLAIVAAIIKTPHRIERVMGFLPGSDDKWGVNFQSSQALGALARAGWDGQGLGLGLARYYLPEIHTDYIFALAAEELGLVLVLLLILMYFWLAVRAFFIGTQAFKHKQYFSAYVAKGICVLIVIQSFLHIGVNGDLLPSKGLTLPFISYGGTSMLVSIACLMLLLRIDYENRLKAKGWKR